MVKYTCERCGETLETDAAPGTREECPVCHKVNTVPEPGPSFFSRLKKVFAADVLEPFRMSAPPPQEEKPQPKPPPVENSLETWVRQSSSRAKNPNLYVGLICGTLLIALGLVLLVTALCMDVCVSEWPDWVNEKRIVNLDLLNVRLVLAIAGTGFLVAGIVTCCLNRIHASIWKIAQQQPEQPR